MTTLSLFPCAWCHGLQDAGTINCPACGHFASRPRAACECYVCEGLRLAARDTMRDMEERRYAQGDLLRMQVDAFGGETATIVERVTLRQAQAEAERMQREALDVPDGEVSR